MKTCLGCGVELTKRHQKKYCSNACQRALERRTNIERWLATGVAAIASDRAHYVRDYLYAEQGSTCALCALPNQWHGASLVLVLDHVNGDPTDNRRENLRLICPNCDSQLPTYKARNRGRGRHNRRQRYAAGESY